MIDKLKNPPTMSQAVSKDHLISIMRGIMLEAADEIESCNIDELQSDIANQLLTQSGIITEISGVLKSLTTESMKLERRVQQLEYNQRSAQNDT